jgi:acetyl-CoA carboxylase alpha subunit
VDHETLFSSVGAVVEAQLKELLSLPLEALQSGRHQKFRCMGRLGREFLERAE